MAEDSERQWPFIPAIFMIHYAPAPNGDVMTAATELLRTTFSSLRQRASILEIVAGASVHIDVVDFGKSGDTPPSMELLRYFGRGITLQQAQQVQASKFAVQLTFAYSDTDALEATAMMTAFAHAIAERTDGLIWDDETRELYTPVQWQQRRLQPKQSGFLDVSRHITIHAYRVDNRVRSITLGMRKFGLPDIMLQDSTGSLARPMSNTINLLAQSFLEQGVPGFGSHNLDVREILHPNVRERNMASRVAGASPIALLTLAQARAADGDPDNKIVEIRFDRYPGASMPEQQNAFATKFFGTQDPVRRVQQNDELRAASARAREELERLRAPFLAGLPPGTLLYVKAPFEDDDGRRELMWIEISKWTGKRIEGRLASDPRVVEKLRAGSAVTVQQDVVRDYVLVHPDGAREGNRTKPGNNK